MALFALSIKVSLVVAALFTAVIHYFSRYETVAYTKGEKLFSYCTLYIGTALYSIFFVFMCLICYVLASFDCGNIGSEKIAVEQLRYNEAKFTASLDNGNTLIITEKSRIKLDKHTENVYITNYSETAQIFGVDVDVAKFSEPVLFLTNDVWNEIYPVKEYKFNGDSE